MAKTKRSNLNKNTKDFISAALDKLRDENPIPPKRVEPSKKDKVRDRNPKHKKKWDSD